MIYNWSFGPFETKGEEKVIKAIHWSLTGEDDETGTSYTLRDCTGLSEPGENFIEYEQLSFETIKQWTLLTYCNGEEPASEVELRLKNKIFNGIQSILHPELTTLNAPWT